MTRDIEEIEDFVDELKRKKFYSSLKEKNDIAQREKNHYNSQDNKVPRETRKIANI